MSETSKIEPKVTRYLPSNGSEGDGFMERFCYRCTREDANYDAPGERCVILDESFGAYPGPGPKEWLMETAKPWRSWCTAFDPRDAAVREQWEAVKDSLPKLSDEGRPKS
jgi:hypothetical protein